MKRGLVVVPAVALGLLLSAVDAAAAEWCTNDPAIHFVDASGHAQTVYLTTYGDGVEHTRAVNAETFSYVVEYGDHGRKTHLRLKVFVPDDSRHHFHVRCIVSTGPFGMGKVLARHDSDSGQGADLDVEVSS